jgi:rhamnosyltransferase subunit B
VVLAVAGSNPVGHPINALDFTECFYVAQKNKLCLYEEGNLEEKRMKILVITQGTYGDIFPLIATAQVLLSIGHEVIISVEDSMEPIVRSYGLTTNIHVTGVMEKVTQMVKTGKTTEIMRCVGSLTEEGYNNLFILHKEQRFDLIIRHFFETSGLILVKELGIPYINVFLTSASFFSRFDPPYSEEMKLYTTFAKYKIVNSFTQWISTTVFLNTVLKDYKQFAKSKHVKIKMPFTEISPYDNWLLGDEQMYPMQLDWPQPISTLGYPFLEQTNYDPHEQDRFFELMQYSSQDKIIVTLGSSQLDDEIHLYKETVRYLRLVYPNDLIVVIAHSDLKLEFREENVVVFDRLNYASIFPQAKIIFHQGGVGTTMEALRAGVPQVIISKLADRPDNAKRIERLKCGVYLPTVNRQSIVSTLQLDNQFIRQTCKQVSYKIIANNWRDNLRAELKKFQNSYNL